MSATKREIFAPDLLSDKRILITGGGTGLGRGVAARLVKHGAEVHLWGRREAVLAEAAEEASGGRVEAAHYQAVDVRDSSSVEAAVARSGSGTGRSPGCSTMPRRTSSPRPPASASGPSKR